MVGRGRIWLCNESVHYGARHLKDMHEAAAYTSSIGHGRKDVLRAFRTQQSSRR